MLKGFTLVRPPLRTYACVALQLYHRMALLVQLYGVLIKNMHGMQYFMEKRVYIDIFINKLILHDGKQNDSFMFCCRVACFL